MNNYHKKIGCREKLDLPTGPGCKQMSSNLLVLLQTRAPFNDKPYNKLTVAQPGRGGNYFYSRQQKQFPFSEAGVT